MDKFYEYSMMVVRTCLLKSVEKILELLKKNGRVIAKDLAESFDMSIDSIRRDLSIMEKDGLLKERTEVQLNLLE